MRLFNRALTLTFGFAILSSCQFGDLANLDQQSDIDIDNSSDQAPTDNDKPEQPSANEPDDNDPNSSDPDTSDPDTSDPDTSDPDTSDPDTSDPDTSDPDTSDPDTSDPDTSDPDTSDPDTSDPDTSDPDTSDPDTSDPDTSDPDTSDPDTSDPDTSDPDTSDPDTSDPDTSDPDTSDPDTSDPDTSDPDTSDPDTSDPDTSDPDTSDPDTSDPDTSVAEKCPTSNIGSLMLQNFEYFELGTPEFDGRKDFQKQFCTSLYTFSGFDAKNENIIKVNDNKYIAEIQKDEPENEWKFLTEKEYNDQQGREAAGQINDAQDFVRFEITDDENSLDGKAIKVLYPNGGNTSSHSGIQYPEHIPTSIAYDRDSDTFSGQNSFQEMYVSYWVMFEDDFTWQGGGKLPGIIAERGFRDPDREERVNTRLMWREEGKLEFYIHSPYLKDKTAGKAYEDRIFWDNGDDFDGHAKMNKGQWHHIEYRMKLNDVINGEVIPNGELEGWLDGKHAAFYNDVTLRGDPDFNINTFFFSTFFGGSSGNGSQVWWPTKDVYAYFDQIEVSDKRIGYSHP